MLAFLDSIFIFLGNILLLAHEMIFSRFPGGKKIFGTEEIPKMIKEWIPWVIIGFFAFSFFIGLYLKSKSKYSKDVIRKILSDSHLEIFGLISDQDINNRITYFRETIIWGIRICFFDAFPYLKFQLGIGNYLTIFNRTGKYQESKIKFKINRDDEKGNNGIAGESWFIQNSPVKRESLDFGTDGTKKDYLEKTNIDEKIFIKLNIKAKSIIGLAIQNIRGQRAGVVVIDTKHSNFSQDIEKKLYDIAKKLMYVV